MREIARALRCDHGSIRNLLAQRGGISPSIRHRWRQALTLAEREDISRGIAADESARSIEARIGRAPSTVSRYPKLSPHDQVVAEFLDSDLGRNADPDLIERLLSRVPNHIIAAVCCKVCNSSCNSQKVARTRELAGIIDKDGNAMPGYRRIENRRIVEETAASDSP